MGRPTRTRAAPSSRVVRLEEWEKGVIKPHEHTLSGPKADRLDLLRATRTQVSPVYCLYRRARRRAAVKLTAGDRSTTSRPTASATSSRGRRPKRDRGVRRR